jgi:hypothetical protein
MSDVLKNIREMRQKAKQKEERYFPKSGNGEKLAIGSFKDGKTYLRVAPSHDPEKNPSPFYPLRSTNLYVELEIDNLNSWNLAALVKEKSLLNQFDIEKVEELKDIDDDKIKTKLKSILGDDFKMTVRKRIFISTIHGKDGSVDLVDEYIKFVVKDVNDKVGGDRDESKKQLAPIFGWRGKEGWNFGITPSTAFVFYAWDTETKNFHEVEVYEKYMDKIEELYAKFDSPDKPLSIDPFSHPTEGLPILFDKVKNDKGKDDFNITDMPFDGREHDSYKEFIAQFVITEEQAKQLKEAKSLAEKIGQGVFKRKDFELQLNGLILFDEKHKFNAFENTEFLEIVEAISAQYDDEEEEAYNPLTNEGTAPVETDEAPEIEPESETDIDKVLNKKPGAVAKKEAETKEVKVEKEVKADSVKETKSTTKVLSTAEKLEALKKKMAKK